MPTRESIRRDLTVATFAALLTGLLALLGWGITDRIHWGGKETQLDAATADIARINDKLSKIPEDAVSHKELGQLQEFMKAQQDETRQDIRDLRRSVERMMGLTQIVEAPQRAHK